MNEGVTITFDSSRWTEETAGAWLVEKGLTDVPLRLEDTDDGEEPDGTSGLIVTKSEELRLVTGPVLIPGKVDLQNDRVSVDEVRKAAHGFLRRGPLIRNQHRNVAEVYVVESWTLDRKTKYVVGARKVSLAAGTWMMTGQVVDDVLWADVKSGKKRGWSLGGTAHDAAEKT